MVMEYIFHRMGKSARGKGMMARRKKRYERLNPIYAERERLTSLRMQYSIAVQSGEHPENPPPAVDDWQKMVNAAPQLNVVHKMDEIEEDVKAFKQMNNFPY